MIETVTSHTELSKSEHKCEYDILPKNGFDVMWISKNDEEYWSKMGVLRGKIYVEECNFLSSDVLDEQGAEYDKYDERSDVFVAVCDDRVIGTVRRIHRGKNKNKILPCEKIFGIDLPGDYEISRIMVDSNIKNRRSSMLVSMSLMRVVIRTVPNPDSEIYAIVEEPMYKYLNGYLGIKLQDITSMKYVDEYKTVNRVVSMDPREIPSQLRKRDTTRKSSTGLAPFFNLDSLGHVDLGALDKSDANLNTVSIPNPETLIVDIFHHFLNREAKNEHKPKAV